MILNIDSRGFDLSESIRAAIQASAKKLEKVFPRIHALHYSVEVPSKHHLKGPRYTARVEMSVPGGEIVVKKIEEDNLYAAIHEVSERAKGKLLKYSKKKKSAKARVSQVLAPAESASGTFID